MTADRPELAVRCPWCGAPPLTRCTTRTGRPLTHTTSHPARHNAWTTSQTKDGDQP